MSDHKPKDSCCYDAEPKVQYKKTLNVVQPSPEPIASCSDSCCQDTEASAEGPIGQSVETQDPKLSHTFNIEGMDCPSCALSIENHLKKIEGVHTASVNFSTGKASIAHELSSEEVIAHIGKAGYKASPATKGKQVAAQGEQDFHSTTVLSGVLLVVGLLGSWMSLNEWLTVVLYAASMVIAGVKPAKSAYYAAKSGSLDMNVLMTAAAVGAAVIGEWLEGATVVWLFSLGNMLQTKSIEKTRDSIRNLMDLAPSAALVKTEHGLVKKAVEEISPREVILIKPGDKIPLDGEIIRGESAVNQAPITGESIPVEKETGDPVYAGTINQHGILEVRVTKTSEDTTLAKIINLVEEAQERKAPTQAFVDRFARIYTPVVFLAALVIILIPPALGIGAWGAWFYMGLELLVIACPCALVISTPVAIVSAIGNAAKNGVLIKGGAFLETAGAIDTIAFDKTGTLTEGKPQVTAIHAYGIEEAELSAIAITLEEYSTHPIAGAIVRDVKGRGFSPLAGDQYRNIVGRGVQATIDGNVYYAGNVRLFHEMKTPMLQQVQDQIANYQQEGSTVVIIGTELAVIGLFSVSDTIRATTTQALQGLKEVGVKNIVMLTGDNQGTAVKLAQQAGIDRYFAELLPEDKVTAVQKLQHEGKLVAMVGDGINDAPALATANLGIAMGGAGTDTTLETADIVLMADNLTKLPHTVKLSRKALAIIKQNIWFSILVKVLALAMIFPGWLTLWMAVLSDTGAALIVILNSMRLLRVKTK